MLQPALVCLFVFLQQVHTHPQEQRRLARKAVIAGVFNPDNFAASGCNKSTRLISGGEENGAKEPSN